MATLQDYFKGVGTGYKPWTLPQVPQTPLFSAGSGFPFSPVQRNLPNSGGQYMSVMPTNTQPSAPVLPTVPQQPVQAPVVPQAPAADPYSKYRDPATGRVLTPQEYANSLASKYQAQKSQGAIPQYALDSFAQKDKTSEQMYQTAYGLNNARNDIATGTTDPYGVATRSGISYSPSELRAIESAYAGIYDPALGSALAKLEAKQKEDAAAVESKNKLAEMAQQHAYNVALKQTPSGDTATGLTGTAGYVEGQNPIVDSWVQRISRKEASLSDITGVKNQGLRDMVNMGLNTVKARNATSAGTLNDVNSINAMLANPSLENISGPMGQFTGGLFGQAKTAKTEYAQIIGALQLAKAGAVKGQGQISDYERKILKEAAAAIDRGMSDEEFRKALVKLRGVLMTSSGLEALVKITDPATGEFDTQQLNTEEINKFIMDGALVEYLE